jgi:two-component system phosphate regulon sensor histidine kinase PhoR
MASAGSGAELDRLHHDVADLHAELARANAEIDRLRNELSARVDTREKEQLGLVEGTLFISEVEVRKAIARQLRNGARLLAATKCVYLLFDGRNDLVAQRPALGFEEEELGSYRVAVGRGVSGEVYRTRKPARIADVSLDPRAGEEPFGALGVRNGICVPLLVQIRDEENRVIDTRAIGVLWVMNSRGGEFSADDERLLTVFARQVAAVVSNAGYIEKLRTENKEFVSTFENLPAGILFVGEDDRIRLINGAARSLFKLVDGRGVGDAYYRVIPHNQTCEVLGACLRDNEDKGAEVPLEVDDEPRVYQIQAARVRGSEEDLNGVVAVFDDVTEIHRLDRMKEEFVQTFSAELLGPLASIRGFSAMLQKTADTDFSAPVRAEIHQIIGGECDRLRRQIQDLLNVSRFEQGIRLHLNLSRFDFDAMVKRVVERETALNRLHHFEVTIPPDLPWVQGDEPRLEEVAYNLVANAVKYSPDGGLVRVAVQPMVDAVRVEVSDQGVGIPLEAQEEVFRKFARLKQPNERVRAGRGIGLFISRVFVEAHGGRIGVQSKPGEGSSFWFWVPVTARPAQG